MKGTRLAIGFIPLVDAAPLIVAQEMGFAAAEGIELDLKPAPSWASLRDMLAFGRVDAAHMLSPVPVASALGIGGAGAKFAAISALSMNGNVVGVSNELAARLRDLGHDFCMADAGAAGRDLIAASQGKLRLGVPFPFSMHAELLYYWLSALGLPAPQSVEIRTVPPALMPKAIEAGEIDAFCVGEPWGSKAVENGVGELLLPGCAIWSAAPEKVLAVRSDWADAEPALAHRLIRAVWRAGRWLGEPGSSMLASELLSRPEYLNVSSELSERALNGRLVPSAQGGECDVPGFVEFFGGAATFPWRSQAEWIGAQLAKRMGLERDAALTAARSVFRSDLYRQALRETSADLPGASSKVEGGNETPIPVASESGQLVLTRNAFFDGRVFDPSAG